MSIRFNRFRVHLVWLTLQRTTKDRQARENEFNPHNHHNRSKNILLSLSLVISSQFKYAPRATHHTRRSMLRHQRMMSINPRYLPLHLCSATCSQLSRKQDLLIAGDCRRSKVVPISIARHVSPDLPFQGIDPAVRPFLHRLSRPEESLHLSWSRRHGEMTRNPMNRSCHRHLTLLRPLFTNVHLNHTYRRSVQPYKHLTSHLKKPQRIQDSTFPITLVKNPLRDKSCLDPLKILSIHLQRQPPISHLAQRWSRCSHSILSIPSYLRFHRESHT
jgi:hypothetical protein